MKRKIVAITGGIGSGKSTVAEILRTMGFTVLNCDDIARKVETMPSVTEQIENLLGQGYVVDGKLVRAKIRKKIFADKQLYARYSAIFWDKIAEELNRQLQNAPEIVFVEIAIINAFPFDWTEVWQVESTEENRINRVAVRDGVTPNSVKNVIAMQNQRYTPTRVIVNDGSVEELENAVWVAVNQFSSNV